MGGEIIAWDQWSGVGDQWLVAGVSGEWSVASCQSPGSETLAVEIAEDAEKTQNCLRIYTDYANKPEDLFREVAEFAENAISVSMLGTRIGVDPWPRIVFLAPK